MKKVTVYCGETVQDKCGNQMHPVVEVEYAYDVITSSKDEIVYSNSSDFISAIKYIGKKQNVETEFYLNGVNYGNDIDPIFDDLNRALDMIESMS